jgi:hypothetical protein
VARRSLRSLGQTMTPTRSTGRPSRLVSSRSTRTDLTPSSKTHTGGGTPHERREEAESGGRSEEEGGRFGCHKPDFEEAEPQSHVTLFV